MQRLEFHSTSHVVVSAPLPANDPVKELTVSDAAYMVREMQPEDLLTVGFNSVRLALLDRESAAEAVHYNRLLVGYCCLYRALIEAGRL